MTLILTLLVSGAVQAAEGMAAADLLERISPVGRVHVEGEPFIEAVSSAAIEEAVEPIAAPTPSRSDYPNMGVSSRAIVWVLAQLHLFFGALV
ncbi:MAG: hypothetical protein ABFR65_12445, partial [Pseudomonadota bacterium]